ncbi:hypothetical protein L9F63_018246, partial [Diploptera punctata]
MNSLVDSIKFLFSAYTENMIKVFKHRATSQLRVIQFVKTHFPPEAFALCQSFLQDMIRLVKT